MLRKAIRTSLIVGMVMVVEVLLSPCLLLADYSCAQCSETVLDSIGPTPYVVGGNGSSWRAVKFEITERSCITKIRIACADNGSGGYIIVEIWSSLNGLPSQLVNQQAVTIISSIPDTGSEVDFEYSVPILLESGIYFAVVKLGNAALYYDTNVPEIDETYYYSITQGGTWVPDSAKIYFKTTIYGGSPTWNDEDPDPDPDPEPVTTNGLIYPNDWDEKVYTNYQDYLAHSQVEVFGQRIHMSKKDLTVVSGFFGAIVAGVLMFVLFRAIL